MKMKESCCFGHRPDEFKRKHRKDCSRPTDNFEARKTAYKLDQFKKPSERHAFGLHC